MAKVIDRCPVDSGEIHKFQHEELETLNKKIAYDTGFGLFGHGLELSGRKISS
jgi:Fe2+ or Zn2+ uptake regulation protein